MFGWFKRSEDGQDIRQIQQATARDLAHLVETVTLQASNIAGLVTVAQTHSEQLQKVTTDIDNLRAGQEQQARVLDYLLRKEQEQRNQS